MRDSKLTPYCCTLEATWVDNVPGKEYYYCRNCKKEVLHPLALEEVERSDNGIQMWQQAIKQVYGSPDIITQDWLDANTARKSAAPVDGGEFVTYTDRDGNTYYIFEPKKS